MERVIAVNRSGPREVCGAVRASGTGRRAGRRPREIAPGMISVVEEKSKVVSPSPRGNAFMQSVGLQAGHRYRTDRNLLYD